MGSSLKAPTGRRLQKPPRAGGALGLEKLFPPVSHQWRGHESAEATEGWELRWN